MKKLLSVFVLGIICQQANANQPYCPPGGAKTCSTMITSSTCTGYQDGPTLGKGYACVWDSAAGQCKQQGECEI